MSERLFGSLPSRATVFLVSLMIFAALVPSTLHAGSTIETVTCGQFLEREFDEVNQINDYKVWMEPGETLVLRVVPIGNTLSVRVYVYEPANQEIAESDYRNEVGLSVGKLSARGLHTIRVTNYAHHGGDSRVGVYTLDISCKRSDGSQVEPGAQGRGPAPATGSQGSAASPLQAASALTNAAAGVQSLGKYADDVQKLQNITSTVSGTLGSVVGAVEIARDLWSAFRKGKGKKGEAQGASPGSATPPSPVYQRPEDLVAQGGQPVYAAPVESLAPSSPRPPIPSAPPPSQPTAVVDRRAFPSLGLGTVLQGEISASTGAQGGRFKAQAGQGIDLIFERLTGAQGLMITVFAPDQRAIFLTSVLSSPKVATTLQLPIAGEYIVEIATAGPAGDTARFSLQLAPASK